MTIRDALKKLFTRNIIIAKKPGGGLKTLDVNKTQTDGSPNAFGRAARWRNGRKLTSAIGYGNSFANYEVEAARQQMYQDYEMMDTDSLISTALDYYADEATSNSANGQLLQIKTDNDEIRKILHNLFYDVVNIEFNLWSIFRTACKYGDFFWFTEIEEGHGIVNVVPIHPAFMIREEGLNGDPNSVQFRYEGDGMTWGNRNIFEQYEIAHFRLITDTNYLPYGRAIIEPGRKEYKRLMMMEDSMLINRIMRAPERRLFKIDVGNIPPNEVESHIEQVAAEMKKTPYIDPATGDFNLRYSLDTSMEDYFLPVRGSESGTTIETLPGLANEGQIQDVEYLRDKLLASLKIPKSFIGFGDGSDAKSGLAAVDVRFARTIERVQKIIVSELYKMAATHLYVQGFDNEDLISFELSLSSPSVIYERQKIDLLTEQVNLIANIKENKLFSSKYIYEVIFQMSQTEWEAERERIIEDEKYAFRIEQIKSEGNDPKETGRTFGTPYDIASLQVASKFNATDNDSLKKMYSPDNREFNTGQPKKYGSFETARDKNLGRDPLGRRGMDKAVSSGSALESFSKLKSKLDKYLVKKNSNIGLLNEDLLLDDTEL